ncbi:hypothetical protein BDV97DRAFT_406180 [Delphinella strobiligena]|nr:hypothetical protein BDV97DRAFT_406180 [Delphinella strobiligena]
MFLVLSPLHGLHEIGTARMHLTPRKSAPRLATDYPSRLPFRMQATRRFYRIRIARIGLIWIDNTTVQIILAGYISQGAKGNYGERGEVLSRQWLREFCLVWRAGIYAIESLPWGKKGKGKEVGHGVRSRNIEARDPLLQGFFYAARVARWIVYGQERGSLLCSRALWVQWCLCVGTRDDRLAGKSDRGFTIVRGIGFQITDLLQALDEV